MYGFPDNRSVVVVKGWGLVGLMGFWGIIAPMGILGYAHLPLFFCM